MKKLLITSTELMMIQFLVPHVKYLTEQGYHVEIACSEVGGRMDDVRIALDGVVDAIHTLRLERSPVNPRNFLGYQDLKKLLEENHYDIIWTNEPVMGVVTRLAANKYRRKGTKVIYMVHGFHFYKGSSLPSWLMYCPIETILSGCMDTLVTINWEDYHWAQKHLHVPRLAHIDGIGVDFSRLCEEDCRDAKREELGISPDELMILSVGELQTRKNHEVMIRAVAKLNNPKVRYVICGRGVLQDHLQKLAEELGIRDRVSFLGYRKDIPQIMRAADIYAHPSKREGLGLASLEAMACGLPLVTSNVQGIPDYVENGVTGFMCGPTDVDGFVRHLKTLIADSELCRRISQTNIQRARKYAVAEIQAKVYEIISIVLNEQ